MWYTKQKNLIEKKKEKKLFKKRIWWEKKSNLDERTEWLATLGTALGLNNTLPDDLDLGVTSWEMLSAEAELGMGLRPTLLKSGLSSAIEWTLDDAGLPPVKSSE